MAWNSREFSPADNQGDQPDREIDEEDPAPAHRDQNPADERPEGRRDAAGSRPRPYGAAPALRGESG